MSTAAAQAINDSPW